MPANGRWDLIRHLKFKGLIRLKLSTDFADCTYRKYRSLHRHIRTIGYFAKLVKYGTTYSLLWSHLTRNTSEWHRVLDTTWGSIILGTKTCSLYSVV